MSFNECVPCWNGASCRWFAVGSCLFNHGGEERHPPRIGGTKEKTLHVGHLEQDILLSIRLVPRIDSGSRGEAREEEQPHREPDQSEPSDEDNEREASWASCEEGWQAMDEPLTLQRASPQSEQVGRVTVEIGGSRSRPCRMAHRWVSKKCKHFGRGSSGTAATKNISWAASPQRQGDYDGVALAGPGPGGGRHS